MAGKTIEAGRGPGGFRAAIAVAAALCMVPVTGSAAPCVGTGPATCLPRFFGFTAQDQRLSKILITLNLLRRALPLPGGDAPGASAVVILLMRWLEGNSAPLPPALFAELTQMGLVPPSGGPGDTPDTPPLFAGGLPGGGAWRNGGLPVFHPVPPGQQTSFAPMSLLSAGGGGTAATQIAPPPAPVPVPASLALLATGLGGLSLMRRRRRQG